MSPLKVEDYEFGKIEYHDCFVVGTIHAQTNVDTKIAKIILHAIKEHYGKQKMVYISNREFGHGVDLSIYKLIDAKRMVGIALVSSHKEELISSASEEQALYSGSFGVFNTLDSAVSWAQSFVEIDDCD